MKHQAKLQWISHRQKTARTTCGKTVSVDNLAVDADTDCPECRADAERQLESIESLLAHAKQTPGLEKCAADLDGNMPKCRADMYRTIKFL